MNQTSKNPIKLRLDEIRERLDEIRERLARFSADRWSHEFSDEGERIVVTRAVMDQNWRKIGDEAPAVLLAFGEEATWQEKEFIREARADLEFLLDQIANAGRMLREARAQLRRLGWEAPPLADQPRLSNLAAEASIKCGEPAFQKYLAERHATDEDGDLRDNANAAAVLRRALCIGSRRDLNTDPAAAERWRDMRAAFLEWGRG